jgi:hypothetical protein
MHKTRSANRKIIALLAICAMLFNALLPTVVFAHATAHPSILAELCTTGEARLTSLDAFSAQQPVAPATQGKIHSAHCPLCCSTVHHVLPPAFGSPAFTVFHTEASIPSARPAPAFAQRDSNCAQPRAPPASA